MGLIPTNAGSGRSDGNPNLPIEDVLEHVGLSCGTPDFESEVRTKPLWRNPNEQLVVGKPGGNLVDHRSVSAVEAICHPENSGKSPDHGTVLLAQSRKLRVLPAGPLLPMIATDQRNEQPVSRIEGEAIGVDDELEAVFVVLAVADDLADVMQQARGLEQRTFGGVSAEGFLQAIEQGEGQDANLLDMPSVTLTAVDELPHGSERIDCEGAVVAHHLEQDAFTKSVGTDRQAG